MKNNVKWELNPEIVARHFFKNVSVPYRYPPRSELNPEIVVHHFLKNVSVPYQYPPRSEPPLGRRPRLGTLYQLELGIALDWFAGRKECS